MTKLPGKIWFEILPPSRQKKTGLGAFSKMELAVIKSLEKTYPELHKAPKKNIRLDEKIIRKILSTVAPLSIGQKARVKRSRFLIDGLERAEMKLGWDLTFPPQLLLIDREKNLVHQDLGLHANYAQYLEAVFIEALEKGLPESLAERVGQILLSAILFGGLHDPRFIQAFPHAFEQGYLYQHSTWMWISLWYGKGTKLGTEPADRFARQTAPTEFRRWVADPLSQTLIIRARQELSEESLNNLSAWSLIQEYLKTVGLDPYPVGSLNQLVDWAKARAVMTLPPFLCAYAQTVLPSSCLPDEIWLRTITPGVTTITIEKQLDEELEDVVPLEETQIYPSRTFRIKDQRKQLKDLLAAIHTQKKEPLKTPTERLQELRDKKKGKMCHTLQLLSYWASQLFCKSQSVYERRKGPPLTPEAIRNYIQAIGEPLLIIGHDINILDLQIDELEELYEEIIEFILLNDPPKADIRKRKNESSKRDFAAGRLAQFHGYLVAYHSMPQVDFPISFYGNSARVDANLITPQMFNVLLGQLGWESKSYERQPHAQLLASILGFKAGMRRAEIAGLRLADIQGDDKLEVIVRKNKYRRLKSQSGRRRIPVHKLLNDKELKCLLDFWQMRMRETNQNLDALLFSETFDTSELISDQYLFEPIRQTLREVTDDETMKFHHLRHSFVSWMILRLLIHLEPWTLSSAGQIWGDEMLPEACKELAEFIFANEWTGRKALYATSIITGHADVPTSFRHYMHLCDYLLGAFVRSPEALPALTAEAIVKLTGSSPKDANLRSSRSRCPLIPFISSNTDIASPHPMLDKEKISNLQPIELKTNRGLPSYERALELFKKHNALRETNAPLNYPKSVRERLIIEQVYATIASTPYESQREMLSLAVKTGHLYGKRDHVVLCPTPGSAKPVIEFLRRCKIEPQRIVYKHHVPPENMAKSAKWNESWSRSLELETGQISSIECSATGRFGDLSIAIIENPQRKASRPKSSYGFRYLLRMLVWLYRNGHFAR